MRQRGDRSGGKQRAEHAEGQDRRQGRAQLADADARAAVEKDEHQRDGYDLLDGDEDGRPAREPGPTRLRRPQGRSPELVCAAAR